MVLLGLETVTVILALLCVTSLSDAPVMVGVQVVNVPLTSDSKGVSFASAPCTLYTVLASRSVSVNCTCVPVVVIGIRAKS